MKNVKPLRAVFIAAFALTLGFAACSSPTNNSGADEQGYPFTGAITIGPAEYVAVGTLLNAVYSGGETGLIYQWNKDGTAIPGADGASYTPASAGSYTVTLSKENYRDKTSAAVNAIDVVTGDVISVKYETLARDLVALAGDSPENPITVIFDAIAISNSTTPLPGEIRWGVINSVIKEAGKYVILDLSACSFAGNLVWGVGGIPSSNSMSVIKDNQCIKGIVLPSSVARIGDSAFSSCSNLTLVSAPGAAAIGATAFIGCGALANVDFPLAETVGRFAFSYCTALANADFPLAKTIGDGAFRGATALTSTDFPLATTIGDEAFAYSPLLERADFPLVETIGNHAFSSCGALRTIVLGAAAPIVGNNCFGGIEGNPTVTVQIPQGASGYGAPGIYDENYSYTVNWANGFRGQGWNGSAFTDRYADTPVILSIEEMQL